MGKSSLRKSTRKYNPDKDNNWTIPDPQTFSDLINRMESRIIRDGGAYKWANLWGRVRLLGLSSRDKESMNSYRRLVEDQFTLVLSLDGERKSKPTA